MSTEWSSVAGPLLVAVAIIVVPGTIVRLAGWRPRELTPYLLIPAMSVAIVALAANAAPLVGLAWGPLPVVLATAGVSAVAVCMRQRRHEEADPRQRTGQFYAAAIGIVAAATFLGWQMLNAFVGPENISQTFDNIVHLNSITLALSEGDSSAFQIGRTSDIGFYPNAWHSVVTLVAVMTGVDTPAAVNVGTLVIAAVVWPASSMAIASAIFRGRAAATLGSAALSTGFAAFPLMLLGFGVLYPNMTGYAILPAGLASIWLLMQSRSGLSAVRNGALLLLVCAGVGLGHPNAFLALFAFGAAMNTVQLLLNAVAARAVGPWIVWGVVTVGLLGSGAVLWRFARTGSSMSQWGPWTGTGQALWEGIIASPRSLPVTIVTALLIIVGIVVSIVRPRFLPVLAPFVVAVLLFVNASGTTYSFLRDALTNPWYNDSFRLAALLPIAAIPVATVAIVAIADLGAKAATRLALPRPLTPILGAVAAVALFAVLATGPNAQAGVASTRSTFELNEASALLTSEEHSLLGRLDTEVPANAVIIGNPWTGASLALALADRTVLERHVFGSRTTDEEYLDANLSKIDSDPRVCQAVRRVGATYVLDFGHQNVFNSETSGLERSGLNDLTPSRHLVLVDSEGPNARLFRIEGC